MLIDPAFTSYGKTSHQMCSFDKREYFAPYTYNLISFDKMGYFAPYSYSLRSRSLYYQFAPFLCRSYFVNSQAAADREYKRKVSELEQQTTELRKKNATDLANDFQIKIKEVERQGDEIRKRISSEYQQKV